MTGRGLLAMLAAAGVWLPPGGARAMSWTAEERVTSDATECETGLNHGALAVNAWGTVIAAWAERDGPRGNFRIHTAERPSGGAWSAPELAVDFPESYAGSNLGAKFPALLPAAGDSLLLVWHDYRLDGIDHLELYAKIRGPGAAWGDSASETRITNSDHPESGGDNSYVPNLARTPDGTAHLAWYDYRYDGDNGEILTKSRTGGAWDTTPGDGPDTNISQNAGNSDFPALAASPDGALHVAWRDNTTGSYRIHYRRRDPSGGWGGDAVLSPAGVAAGGVTLAAGGDGTVLAAWSDARTGATALYARERSPAGAWGPPRRVSPDGVGAEESAAAVDAGGRRHLVWQDARESAFNREIFHQAIDAGGVWDSTGASDFRISTGAGKSSRPTLLLDAAGRAHVVWQDARHGATELYYRRGGSTLGAPGGAPGPPVLRARPNPFRSRVTVTGLGAAAREMLVFDARGRRLAVVPAADGAAVWDGRTPAGAPAPAGLYFVAPVPRGAAAPARVLRLP